ncbi:PREDICTED: splicing factor 3A subunit 1-like [Camelina sativa]|uniref:Splicing factor 3A subunit 1-like n=1 Tax=Camelina sativa TaxID=90675 RepID=A0ABM0U6C9_CAMSA|nr:PREDICTED: splicing factor 3A subunit 1-like [Camelina sativa]
MSTSTQNESQSEQNNQGSRSIEIIEPPADTIIRTFNENTARAVSKNGSELERKLIDPNPNDARLNFLRNSSDPCHAYYKHKLAEHVTRIQNGATEGPDIKIFHAPPYVTATTIFDTTARLVSKFGSEFESMVRDSNTDDARFNFLNSSSEEDPCHALYQQKLAEYSSDPRYSYYSHKLTEYLVQIPKGSY